jgi:surfeit locus 1 family protein
LVRRVPGDGQLPPQRHLGYAVQWFALALTLLVLGLWLEWRRRRE